MVRETWRDPNGTDVSRTLDVLKTFVYFVKRMKTRYRYQIGMIMIRGSREGDKGNNDKVV